MVLGNQTSCSDFAEDTNQGALNGAISDNPIDVPESDNNVEVPLLVPKNLLEKESDLVGVPPAHVEAPIQKIQGEAQLPNFQEVILALPAQNPLVWDKLK